MKTAPSLAPALALMVLMVLGRVGCARPPAEASVAVSAKRLLLRTDENFLGLQLDPAQLLSLHEPSWGSARALALARGLAPAYLLVAGPGTRSLLLGADGDDSGSGSGSLNATACTESDWLLLARFCSAAGLRAAVALPVAGRGGSWDPRPFLPMLGLAASLGCNFTLQLGFEPQETVQLGEAALQQAAGLQAGRDSVALRRLLDAFPQCASRARLLAPDVSRVRAPADAAFVRAALDAAAPHLSGLSWRPRLWETGPEARVGAKARGRPLEQLQAERDALLRLLPRAAQSQPLPPLWIGEAAAEAAALGEAVVPGEAWEAALRWARLVGLAARLRAAVVLSWLRPSSLLNPPPEYWVSLLHRRLVGEGVLETRVVGGTGGTGTTGLRLDVFGHCARRPPGALLLLAVNRRRARVRLTLKGMPGSTTGSTSPSGLITQYALTHSDGATLLNGEPLDLHQEGSDGSWVLPALRGRPLPSSQAPSSSTPAHTPPPPLLLMVPARAIVFWVLPEAGMRACATPNGENEPDEDEDADYQTGEEKKEEEDENEKYEEEEEEEKDAVRWRGLGRRRGRKGLSSGGLRDRAHWRRPLERQRHRSQRLREHHNNSEDEDEAEEEGSEGEDYDDSVTGTASDVQSDADAVWSIAQASLLAAQRATLKGDEGEGSAEGDGEAHAPPALPKEREKYLKAMFVNMITKGPDAVERPHPRPRRHADPSLFVEAAAPRARRRGAAGGSGAERRRARARAALTERRTARGRERDAPRPSASDRESMGVLFGSVDLTDEKEEEEDEGSFPQGDVYLREGNSASAERNRDYDYVQEPDSPRIADAEEKKEDDEVEHQSNVLTEYEHSELFEALGVERAPMAAPPACPRELFEAMAMRAPAADIPASTSPAPSPSPAPAVVADQLDDVEKLVKPQHKHNVLMDATSLQACAEETVDYRMSEKEEEEVEADRSVDFEEALARADVNSGGGEGSCEAGRAWTATGLGAVEAACDDDA